jgi:hypothetical protein
LLCLGITQNGDTILLGCLLESWKNSEGSFWTAPAWSPKEGAARFPDIVKAELWSNLNSREVVQGGKKYEPKVLYRVGMQQLGVPAVYPNGSFDIGIAISRYDHITEVPVTRSLDYPRLMGGGGWEVPAADLARVLASVHASRSNHPKALLSANAVAQMLDKNVPGNPNVARNTAGGWYWDEREFTNGTYTTYHHSGSWNGGNTLAMLRDDGLGVVLIFNQGLLHRPRLNDEKSFASYLSFEPDGWSEDGNAVLSIAERIKFPDTDDFFTDNTLSYESFGAPWP